MRILVVEDDPVLLPGLRDLIRGAGHEVLTVSNGRDAVKLGTEEAFDIVVLDVMLPGLDGLGVCEKLKLARPGLGILMLTAMGSESQKVQGLRTGADDYVTKPFGPRELLARIDALGRRMAAAPAGPERIEADGCVLDLGLCKTTRAGVAQDLTAREAGILRWLHRNRGRALSRAELLEQVWGGSGELETRTVDMAIANLRGKIEKDSSNPRIIITVKGVGYRWGDS